MGAVIIARPQTLAVVEMDAARMAYMTPLGVSPLDRPLADIALMARLGAALFDAPMLRALTMYLLLALDAMRALRMAPARMVSPRAPMRPRLARAAGVRRTMSRTVSRILPLVLRVGYGGRRQQ